MDIRIKHLGKAYGEQQILKDFSCLFPEGKTSCIRGKSGCGKKTEKKNPKKKKNPKMTIKKMKTDIAG